MSIRDCIIAKMEEGIVDEDRTQQAVDLFDDMVDEFSQSMGRADAEAEAGAKVLERLEIDAKRRRVNHLRDVGIMRALEARIDNYRTAKGEARPDVGAKSIYSRDLNERDRVANVEDQHKSVLAMAHSIGDNFIAEARPKMAGLKREKALIDNVVAELFGEESADGAARLAADAWKEMAEYLRQRFNKAGGNIAKRIDWGLPQKHDPVAVGQATEQEWIDHIWPLLDRGQMIDQNTGLPMSDFRLLDVLRTSYHNIKSGGLAGSPPNLGQRGQTSVANSRQQARVLIFNNAEDWLTYQRKFGAADLHETMLQHIDDMSMDIARMEILGSNPEAMTSFIKAKVKRDASLVTGPAKEQRRARDRAATAEKTITTLNDIHTGRDLVPVNSAWAKGFQDLRNVLTAAQLGGAAISAVTDLAFQRMARRFVGARPVSQGLVPLLRLMSPSNIEDQQFAVRMALGAENWSSMALAQRRYTGDVVGRRWSRLFADFTLRAGLLSPWTQAGRWSFGLDALAHFSDMLGRGFSDMPDPTARVLRDWGIGEDEWKTITEVAEHRGVNFLDIPKLMERDRNLGEKLHRLLLQNMEFAVPTGSDRVRAQLRAGQRPGTWPGELINSVSMYKTFPMLVMHTHVMRGLNQEGLHNKAAYMANLILSTTIMGAAAWQAKQIAKGRDPVDMNTGKFLAAAAIQGGGLGIFGDFMFSDTSRYGRGVTSQIAGPVAGLLEDAARLTQGNIAKAAQDKDVNVAGDLVRFGRHYTPAVSSIFYTRLLMERYLFDQLELMVDDNARGRFRRTERRARKDFGQEFFWRPGRTSPTRAPEVPEFPSIPGFSD